MPSSLERQQKPVSLWRGHTHILLSTLQDESLNTTTRVAYAQAFLHVIILFNRVLPLPDLCFLLAGHAALGIPVAN